jgi:aryl-alcohol dehydrogenase (NADP+)
LGTAAERYQDRYWHEGMFETVEQLRPLAQEVGMSLPQLAVAWVLANPVITAPIIGASRPEQLEETLKAVETPLSAELKQRLDDLTSEYRKGDAAR